MISILIADDHPMVREGLAAMLESEEGFSVVSLAPNGEVAFKEAMEKSPNVILSDVRMPKADGFSLLEKIRTSCPATKLILLAGMPLKDEEARAKANGASGYLPKDVDQDRLSQAIRDAVGKDGFFACEHFQSAPSPLTGREMDVLKLVARGMQRDQIASSLGIGTESVKTHMKGIMTKLNCPNSTSAVGRAYELGILRA